MPKTATQVVSLNQSAHDREVLPKTADRRRPVTLASTREASPGSIFEFTSRVGMNLDQLRSFPRCAMLRSMSDISCSPVTPSLAAA